ncbi:MAG: MFS transporter [Candidatus Eremiobacteraeota bacterium]|nr:MFS transporter [Candidatus Eremiobacteraeota bacterium]
MQSPAPAVNPARLAAFNFGIQVVWGAILGVSLQARSAELGGTNGIAAYAGLAAGGAAVAVAVQLLAGFLSDRRRTRVGHRREFSVAGAALALPALVWFYLAPDWTQLVAAFISLQIGMNVAAGPYQAAIPDAIPQQARGLASSWMAGFQSLGNAAGLLLVISVHDPRSIALGLALPFAASWAITFGALRARPEEGGVSGAPSRLFGPNLRVLLLSRGLVYLGFFTLVDFLLFFVRDSLRVAGSDAVVRQTGLLFLTFTCAAAAGAALAARPADRYDKRAVVTVACAVMALALALLASAAATPIAYAAAFAAGVAWGAFLSADWALATVLLPAGAMATAMGIWNVSIALPQVAAPLLTLPFVNRFNERSAGLGPRIAICLAIVELLAGAAWIWRLPPV